MPSARAAGIRLRPRLPGFEARQRERPKGPSPSGSSPRYLLSASSSTAGARPTPVPRTNQPAPPILPHRGTRTAHSAAAEAKQVRGKPPRGPSDRPKAGSGACRLEKASEARCHRPECPKRSAPHRIPISGGSRRLNGRPPIGPAVGQAGTPRPGPAAHPEQVQKRARVRRALQGAPLSTPPSRPRRVSGPTDDAP